MSEFSGKCDLRDHAEIFGIEKTLQAEYYIDGNKIDIRTEKDLAKYYPYIVIASVSDKIWLSFRSYIDAQEEETLNFYLQDALRYYRKCKRKKIPFDKEEVMRELGFLGINERVKEEIVRRVAKNGAKATIDNIETNMARYYRRKWKEELIRVGWSEAEAERWIHKNR